VLAVVVALLAAGGAFAATRGGSGPSDEVDDGGERIVVPSMTLGSGELPGGFTWTLAARREGSVCTQLTTTPGPAAPERCLRSRSYRPIGNTSTRLLRGTTGTIYLTVGQASEQAERIRVTPDGVAPFEVPTLGGGSGLDIRFFVMHTTANVAVSFTALAADGTELGRVDRPKLPTS
jgi:hypothetical protein